MSCVCEGRTKPTAHSTSTANGARLVRSSEMLCARRPDITMAMVDTFLTNLRALRALRLFRSYRIASRMKRDFPFVRRNYETIVAGTHLFVFLFVMTAVVYETQHQHNPAIGNYVDALYFTVATLTTTGFGDITLPGTTGRLLSIVMMIVGVSLFVRMVQVLFRPRRMHHKCASCGLSEHETDAVHCKRCGMLLHLTT